MWRSEHDQRQRDLRNPVYGSRRLLNLRVGSNNIVMDRSLFVAFRPYGDLTSHPSRIFPLQCRACSQTRQCSVSELCLQCSLPYVSRVASVPISMNHGHRYSTSHSLFGASRPYKELHDSQDRVLPFERAVYIAKVVMDAFSASSCLIEASRSRKRDETRHQSLSLFDCMSFQH